METKEGEEMTLGEKLIKLRRTQGLTEAEMAEKMQVSPEKVALWEQGETVPTIVEFLRLKEQFGISIDRLLLDSYEGRADFNSDSMTTVCGALAYAMGVKPPKDASPRNETLCRYIDEVFGGETADRVVMYNPDAIGQWVYEKYPQYFEGVKKERGLELPLATVSPTITPACFASMYTGVHPDVHGVKRFITQKDALTRETLFDALIAAEKRVALVCSPACSLGKLYLGRDIDYFLVEGGISAVNAKAVEVILRDEHDFIAIYNGNYDHDMHLNGTESAKALSSLRVNSHIYSVIANLIKEHWGQHNTLLGFAMDHGCHEVDKLSLKTTDIGGHGCNTPEDVNIVHVYKGYKRQ